ncbi:MAG TPA: GNAT family N-acetyltransferase [Clostridiaceae bacterium]|nr:GNAT family N-acetyltransferase [Clostridiaceae bacterium]
MIKYRKGYDIDYIRLIELLNEAGSDVDTDNFKDLVQMVENSALVLTAWDFDYMVGFVRVDLTGENAIISDLVVDNEYRDMDICKNMIGNVLSCYPGSKFTLKADKKDGLICESLGFRPVEDGSGLYCRY